MKKIVFKDISKLEVLDTDGNIKNITFGQYEVMPFEEIVGGYEGDKKIEDIHKQMLFMLPISFYDILLSNGDTVLKIPASAIKFEFDNNAIK